MAASNIIWGYREKYDLLLKYHYLIEINPLQISQVPINGLWSLFFNYPSSKIKKIFSLFVKSFEIKHINIKQVANEQKGILSDKLAIPP